MLLFLFCRLILFRVDSAASFDDAPFDKLVEARSLIDPQVKWVILHVSVNIALFNVLFIEEASHFTSVRILCRLLKVLGKVCFPVSVDEVVVHGLEGFDFAFRPFVEVNGFYLRNVDAQRTMLT